MNVLSLFDGIACGKVALDRVGIKYDKYFASEIDKYAIKVAMKNHPDIIQLGDVRNVKGESLPKIDLLMGGSPCFIAGTKVITDNGYVPIEKIKIGEKVLTHTRQFKKVLCTGSEKKETIILSAQGIKNTETTYNHPYYVKKLSKIWNNNKRIYERCFSEPNWIPAGQLTKNHFVGLPIILEEHNPRNLTEEDCWLIGRYIADGHIRKSKRKNRKNSYQYQVVYSIGSHKVDNFMKNITRNVSCYPHTKSVYRVVINSKKFLDLLDNIGVGKGAINKNIPMELLTLPKKLLKIVLDGYLSGDGYRKKEGHYKANSISENLIMSLNLAIAKIYETNSSFWHIKKEKKTIIEGRYVNQRDYFETEFRTEIKKQTHAFVDGGFIWLPVKKIEKTNTVKDVYNLEVECDNSYTANNAVVHNCQDISQAMKNRQGLKGSKSSLFFEFARVYIEVNPKYFLFENVGGAKKEDIDIISSVLCVDPIRINSSLVSAALRNRLYWTNIKDVEMPKDKNIKLQDVLESGYTDREKARALLSSDSRPLRDKKRMIHRYRNTGFTTLVFDDREMTPENCRYLTQIELERCMNLPVGYTQILKRDQAAFHIGNGWTVDVIAHIFKNILVKTK